MRQKITPDALYDLTFPSDPRIGPAGQVAYVRSRPVRGTAVTPPRYESELVVLDVLTGEETHCVVSVSAAARPVFSPDGAKLAYLAPDPQTGAKNAWVLDLASGKRGLITRFLGGVRELEWLPNGGLVVIARDAPSNTGQSDDGVRVIERVHYKLDGVGFRPTTAAQIFVVGDVDAETPKPLTSFAFNPSCLTVSRGGERAYAVVSEREEEDDRWLRTIVAVDLATGGIERVLAMPMTVNAISLSPQEDRIAFLAAPDPANFANLSGLWVLDLASGRTSLVSEEFNGSHSIRGDSRFGHQPNVPAWLDDSTLLVNRNTSYGGAALHAVDVATGDCQQLFPDDMVVTSFHHQGGSTAYVAERTELPGELFIADQSGQRVLTRLNEGWCRRYVPIREHGPFEYGAGKATGRQYWTLEPADPRADRAVVLEVHAGAQTVFGLGFFLEFQVLASHGYRVLYGNPGETGSPRNTVPIGPEHPSRMLDRYTVAYPADTIAMLDAALARWGTPDAPVHITGGSNGGYMTNWLIATTDRFTSAAADRSITNLLSAFGTSDIGFNYVPLEHGGNPWDHHDLLWQQSPLKHAASVRTPVLILHGEEDHRCPIGQAEEWYAALKHFGNTEVRFVRFSGEGHDMSRDGRPDRRVRRIEEIVRWFELHPIRVSR